MLVKVPLTLFASVKEREEKQRIKREQKREEEDGAKGLLLECQCCFTDFCFDVMGKPMKRFSLLWEEGLTCSPAFPFEPNIVQCSEAHLFCRECVSNLVSNQIGNRQYVSSHLLFSPSLLCTHCST